MKILNLRHGLEVKLSDEDYDKVVAYGGWFFEGRYIVSCRNKTKIYLHRFLLDFPIGFDVDHVNGDKLDNTRENLRTATRSQNNFNAKVSKGHLGYKGVSVDVRSGKYYSYGRLANKKVHLVTFDTPELAALAYNEFAKSNYGEFASLNDL